MRILNPLYDASFKYLMADQRVAILLLSTLLEKEVVNLEPAPTEMATEKMPILNPARRKKKKTSDSDFPERASLTVYRIDFAATIREADGTLTQVLIELQKARLINNLPRFRKYLAEQYQNPNLYRVTRHEGYKMREGIPIYAIYLLGYLPDLRYANTPVVQVQNHVTDRFSGKTVAKDTPFITSLFHEGLIVNIPALKERRRNRVEQMLSIFENAMIPQLYTLDIDPTDYPSELSPIIRRLQIGAADSTMKRTMQLEDEILDDMLEMEMEAEEAQRLKAEAERQKEEAERQKEEAERQKEEAVQQLEQVEQQKEEAERQKEEAERQRAEAERQRAEAEQQKKEAEQQKKEAVQQLEQAEQQKAEAVQRLEQAEQSVRGASLLLYQQGIPAEMIAAQLNIPIETLQKWLK